MEPVLKPRFIAIIQMKCAEKGVKITEEQVKAVFEAMIWAKDKLSQQS